METPTAQFIEPTVTQTQTASQSPLKQMLLGILGLAVVAGAALGGYFIGRQSVVPSEMSPITQLPEVTSPGIPEGIACTMEVKICPDGSAVGRSGPSCEFAPCPTTATSSAKINYMGVPLPSGAEPAVNEGFAVGMKRDGINDETVPNQYRQMGFTVIKADENWFWGIGSVHSSQQCVIPPGGTECNVARTSFLLIGHKVNGQWQMGFEYTPAFNEMVAAAPDTITTPAEKQIHKQ